MASSAPSGAATHESSSTEVSGGGQPSPIVSFFRRAISAVMERWPVILGVWVVVVSLSSRALLPGVRGAVVGISGAIDDADSALAIASFLTAYYLLATALLSTFRVVRTRMPISLRVVVILLAAMLFFNGLGSMVSSRAPISVIALMSLSCSIAAITLGGYASRRPEVGFVAFAPVVVGVASILRGVGAVVSERVTDIGADLESITSAFRLATILATLSFVLSFGAIAIACAWMIKRSPRAGGIVVGALVLFAVVGGKIAASPPDDLEPILFVVLRRAVQHVLTRPAPLLPEIAVMATAILAPLVALAAFLQRHAPSRLAAAVGLAVLAGDAADIPILGLGLACGALFLGAYAADPHGISAAVSAADDKRASLPR